MKKRIIKSFNSWEEVVAEEISEAKKSSPEERMQILFELMEIYSQLPQQDHRILKKDPHIIKRKKL